MEDDRDGGTIKIRCPYDQACNGCFISLTEGREYQCPKYPKRWVRLEHKVTEMGTEYVCITLHGEEDKDADQ